MTGLHHGIRVIERTLPKPQPHETTSLAIWANEALVRKGGGVPAARPFLGYLLLRPLFGKRFWCGVRRPCRPAWLPVAHSVPPPPRGRPAPDLHALFGTRPQPTHSAHSLTSPDHLRTSTDAGIERARILCPACCPACMMCPCEHTRVVCPADHPQPANDDEQTQPVGAIVGSDEQQRARSCRAGAHAVPSQPTVHPLRPLAH